MHQNQQMFLLKRVKKDEDRGALGQMLTEPGASLSVTEARASCLSRQKLEETFSLDELQTTLTKHQQLMSWGEKWLLSSLPLTAS